MILDVPLRYDPKLLESGTFRAWTLGGGRVRIEARAVFGAQRAWLDFIALESKGREDDPARTEPLLMLVGTGDGTTLRVEPWHPGTSAGVRLSEQGVPAQTCLLLNGCPAAWPEP